MNRASLHSFLCFFLAGGCTAGQQVDTLVESEQAFATRALDRGTRAAFLSFLDDSAVIFRPHPVNGKEWFGKQPDQPTVLAWEPEFADCSAGGDLGYTTGPWRLFASHAPGEPVASGCFVSVWKREPGREWKVVLDLGIRASLPLRAVDSVRTGSLSRMIRGNRPASPDSFLEAEKQFRKAVERSGILEAYRLVAAAECRFYRQGHAPAVGLQEAHAFITRGSENPVFTLLAIQESRSSDLAYAYGRYESGYYLHIWQNSQEGVKLVLDLLSPLSRQ